MKQQIYLSVYLLYFAIFLLVGCGSGAVSFPPESEVTYLDASSPTPTSLSTSTLTPTPSQTTTPSPTPSFITIKESQIKVDRVIHGYICNDTWDGIIYIDGDIVVPKGCVVRINPGSTIYVAANEDYKNLFVYADYPEHMYSGINTENKIVDGVHKGEPWYDEGHHISILVEGVIEAKGTEEKSILFTSSEVEPTRWDWNFFTVEGKGLFEYATIEYCRSFEPAGSGSRVRRSTIRHIGGSGIWLGISKDVEITENTIYDAGHELIDTHGSTAMIINNDLGPNMFSDGTFGVAIIIDGGSPQIIGNKIHDTSRGILFLSEPDTSIRIEENKFQNNSHHFTCGPEFFNCNDFLKQFLDLNEFILQ